MRVDCRMRQLEVVMKYELAAGCVIVSGYELVTGCEDRTTSGARYSGVPQNVFMVAASVMPSLHKPKSVILMWPSLSSIRFSS